METFFQMLWLVVALGLLFVGAEGLVRGSSSLALRLGLSPLVIGLTVVAFGTSAPEMVVSVKAALGGQGSIAVGNAIGSNLFNIGVILGITALLCPVPVKWPVIKIDAPVMIAVALLGTGLLLDGRLGRLEGIVLFAGAIGYTFFSLWLARKGAPEEVAEEFSEGMPAQSSSAWRDATFLLVGLGILVLGSRLLVDNASALARTWGVSEAVIGLTIVSAGTSMPELATSALAALRKQPDIAIGNIVGSNIFNILGILGVASLVAPLQQQGIGALDYLVMLGFSVALLPMLWTGLLLRRLEGAILLGGYGVYLWAIWP